MLQQPPRTAWEQCPRGTLLAALWVPTNPSQRGLEAGDVTACPRWDFTPAPLPLDQECDV